jgi:hypothetical protein
MPWKNLINQPIEYQRSVAEPWREDKGRKDQSQGFHANTCRLFGAL